MLSTSVKLALVLVLSLSNLSLDIETLDESNFSFKQSNNTRRSLASASAANSVVSGIDSLNIAVHTNFTITVTAKDASGNLITTGGDIFCVVISSTPCAKLNDHLCSTSVYPEYSYLNTFMIDKNNGTYTYSNYFGTPGTYSIQVYLLTQGEIYQEFFNGTTLSGTSTGN